MHQHTHTVNWELKGSISGAVERYCTGCGKKVEFRDSGVRRHNANGKNLTQFAIYKCHKGHTWNQKLQDYKAKAANEVSDPRSLEREGYKKHHDEREELGKGDTGLHLSSPIELQCFKDTYKRIDICITGNGQAQRVDKMLTDLLLDVSREQVKKAILGGLVVINGSGCKASSKVKRGDVVGLYPNEINGICRL